VVVAEKKKCWRVDMGGATYWVAAYTAEGAKAFVLEHDVECIGAEEAMDNYQDATAEEFSIEKADKIMIRDDSDGNRLQLSTAMDLVKAHAADHIIACSEW
jgi:nitrous oxide reductase accessory protein NosL